MLDERVRRWLDRVAAAADDLEALALEWKADQTLLDVLPMGADVAHALDPTIGFVLPHAALVMDAASQLRKIVAAAPFGVDPD